MKSLRESKLQYRRQLRKCGFTSWKKANLRRGKLIVLECLGNSTQKQHAELEALQKLVHYKMNCDKGCRAQYRHQERQSRKVDKLLKKLDEWLQTNLKPQTRNKNSP